MPYFTNRGITPLPVEGAFTPLDLPNLLAWYKADAGVTGSPDVTAWADQSGNGWNLANPTTPRPQLSAAALNGLPVILFDATSGNCFVATAADAVSLGSPNTLSVFAVTRNVSHTDGTPRIVVSGYTGGNDTATTGFYMLMSGTAADMTMGNSGTARNNAVTANTWYQFGGIMDGSFLTTYVNNVAGSPAADTNVLAANWAIKAGNGESAGGHGNSSTAEIVMTTSALSGGDRTNLYNYFLAKWGVG